MGTTWKIPGAIILAGALVAGAMYVRPTIGEQEIRLSEQELLRVDAVTGRSQACTTHDGRERCLTLSGPDGRFLPHITEDMRALGVRDTVRARLRGE